MCRWKILVGLSMLFAGLGLSLSLPLVPARGEAPSGDPATVNRLLLMEIQALRKEIGTLQTDIAGLRQEIRALPVVPGRGPAPDAPVVGTTPPTPPGVITVEFTKVPSGGAGEGTQGDIAGRVAGSPGSSGYKIVLYALTNQWYVQPLADSPFTDVNADGTWSTWTHLGYRYAAVLVRPSFKPQGATGKLPSVGGDVIAVATTGAKQ